MSPEVGGGGASTCFQAMGRLRGLLFTDTWVKRLRNYVLANGECWHPERLTMLAVQGNMVLGLSYVSTARVSWHTKSFSKS